MSHTLQYMKSLVKSGIDTYQKSRKKNDKGDVLKEIKKSDVLMEARIFNDTQLLPKRCRTLLAKIVYLINQGEVFSENESTTLFFSITKLFQSNDKQLRRMIYLCVKELQNESSVYILTSSITKDINEKDELFRMNSIRVTPIIARHTDPTNLQQIERYIKNQIGDKDKGVSSSTLLAGLQLMQINYQEMVRKWQTEILDRLRQANQNSYHALILLYQIKQQDQMGFTKVIQGLTNQKLDDITNFQLIRFAKQILVDHSNGEFMIDQQTENVLIEYIKRNIHKPSDMVSLEACRAYCDLKQLTNKDIQQAISVLLLLLANENNSVTKFSSLKILNKLVNSSIRANLMSNLTEIEALIHDNNRSIATMAISLLLKVCKENQINKLLNQIQEYISEISDEFKQDVLKSIKSLIKTQKKQYKNILKCLFKMLDQNGTQEFKKQIIQIIEETLDPEHVKFALMGLVEYIEDCEFNQIHLMVLNIFDQQIKVHDIDPTQFIRFIYNRVFLEVTEVRSKAISTLANIALISQQHQKQIMMLLNSLLKDEVDEIREKALYYIDLIESGQQSSNEYLNNVQINAIQKMIENDDNIQLNYQMINNYMENNDMTQIDQTTQKKKNDNDIFEMNQESESKANQKKMEEMKQIAQIDQNKFIDDSVFGVYGKVLMIQEPQKVTDSQFEFQIEVGKYMFENNIILEYSIENTLDNIVLRDLSIQLELNCDNIQIQDIQTLGELKPKSKGKLLIGIAVNPESRIPITTVNSFMNCQVVEIQNGKAVNEYSEDYQLEDMEIKASDFIVKHDCNFKATFDKLENEATSNFQMPYPTLESVIQNIIKHFNMIALDGSASLNVQSLQKNSFHQLKLAGKFLNKYIVCMDLLIGYDQNLGYVVKAKAKADDCELLENLLETLEQ